MVQLQRVQDGGHEGRAGDQVDIVRALILQVPENLGQALNGNILPLPLVADGKILAVSAAQGAPRKEHRAAAARAGNAGLLPEMQRRPGDAGLFAHAAEPGFHAAVHPALAGAQGTDRHGKRSFIRRDS